MSVPQTDVKSILANLAQDTENTLRDRLLTAGVSYKDASPVLKEINDLPHSPFQDMLDWAYNRNGEKVVPLTAVEQALRFLRATFAALEADDDSLIEIFCAIWNGVRSCYPELWKPGSRILTKVCITALNEHLGQKLKTLWESYVIQDLFDPKELQDRTAKLVEPTPAKFWEAEWRVTVQDNANVREMIKADLEQMAANHRASRRWTEGLGLPKIADNIDPNASE